MTTSRAAAKTRGRECRLTPTPGIGCCTTLSLAPVKTGGFLGGKSCERGFRTLEADVEPGFSPLSVLLPSFRTSEKKVDARRNLAPHPPRLTPGHLLLKENAGGG